jgi:hypothetical protein
MGCGQRRLERIERNRLEADDADVGILPEQVFGTLICLVGNSLRTSSPISITPGSSMDPRYFTA